jgi:hypothetical protein
MAASANGAPAVVFGVADTNLAYSWSTMNPLIAPLGSIQVGVSIGYRCEETTVGFAAALPPSPADIPVFQPLLVSLVGAPACTPRTSAQRRAYARFARDLVRLYPNIRELNVWNEPELWFWKSDIRDYTLLLAATYDRLRGTGVKVLGPGFSPGGLLGSNRFNVKSFASDVAAYYGESGRRRPILDGFAYHPYWGFCNAVTSRTARTLNEQWRGLPQPSPHRGLRFWWTETGADTVTPDGMPGYYGEDPKLFPSQPLAQARRVGTLARLARSNPLIAADFNFLLIDEPDRARWQSGLYYIGGIPKPAFFAFRDAIGRRLTRPSDQRPWSSSRLARHWNVVRGRTAAASLVNAVRSPSPRG